MTETEEFRRLGEERYGAGWQTTLARLLGVNIRTVRRWALSERAVPPELLDALRRDPDDDEGLAVEVLVARLLRLFAELRGKNPEIAKQFAARLARETGPANDPWGKAS